jgi:UDP-glucose 4-epimerase
VLVTGAAGLIGRPTVGLLVEDGHDVLATDLHVVPAGGERVRWLRLDVRRGKRVRASVEAFGPDTVVHLAARHFIPWCDRHPAATLATNVIGTQNVADAINHLGGARLVFASSAAVYGPSARRLRENDPLDPDDVYGTSKLTCERLLGLARSECEGAVVLRLFNTIGPGDPHPHLVPRLISELRRGDGRVRVGNLASVRDYVYVDDVARAIVAAVRADVHGLTVANVGTGTGRSVGEVVETLGTLVGRPLEVVSIAARRRTVDRPFLVADNTYAQTVLGWEPRVPFATALARTLRAGSVELASELADDVDSADRAPALALA